MAKTAKPKPKTKPVAFRIPGPLLDRLDAVADQKFLSRNQTVITILDEKLPKRIKKEEDNAQLSMFD